MTKLEIGRILLRLDKAIVREEKIVERIWNDGKPKFSEGRSYEMHFNILMALKNVRGDNR